MSNGQNFLIKEVDCSLIAMLSCFVNNHPRQPHHQENECDNHTTIANLVLINSFLMQKYHISNNCTFKIYEEEEEACMIPIFLLFKWQKIKLTMVLTWVLQNH